MMMKGMMMVQTKHQLVDETVSNLTSASGDASVSSNHQQSSSFASPTPVPNKKKRSLPGNPDPDAEVIALSPKTLMATNRFVCEICNKGFQRDQNLQLHRRGHNLPWKLKQRSSKEVRKKVYICPEVSCVHHDPSRALGDLTGIKKHFSRKHGEKKWKCDKCSKKYAVQSDWKAHSKICGTREYRCDCGTLFSRRDSFITHRAFCDALAEESARAIAANPLGNHNSLLFPHSAANPYEPSSFPLLHGQFGLQQPSQLQDLSLKREQQQQQQLIPPWMSCQGLNLPNYSTRLEQSLEFSGHENPSFDPHPPLPQPLFQAAATSSSPHMSATALLQKAAEMGATMSRPPHLGLMAAAAAAHSTTTNNAALVVNALGLSSSSSSSQVQDVGVGGGSAAPAPLLQDMVTAPGFDGSSFEEAFVVMQGSAKRAEAAVNKMGSHGLMGEEGGSTMTRDFLGLKALTQGHRDHILHLATGLDACLSSSSSYEQQLQQNKKPWHG
ncbi:protein indeterminate-domain 7 [Canna indica]|uniref:Protein EARLY HEADING DATE 2 n=1 Tax=Canna indica TaxID=4628 RepID=A0AAQ3KGV5_9LILI|nr:protein indeterminate-domain 7 [Canna indica]